MRLDQEWIARQIPHHGSMCLLNEVLQWDEQSIHCRSVSHRSSQNPLRAYGRLAAVCGVEYAAQSMAIHGALLNGAASPPGYLASVRGLRLHTHRLDDIADELLIVSQYLSGDAMTIIYAFKVSAPGFLLLEGRATVILNPAAFST